MTEHDTRAVFDRVCEGDDAAAREIFERYVQRLTALACVRLSAGVRQRLDAEDVLQSAFRSFFARARQGQYALERSGDLWRLLAAITRHKVLKKVEHHTQHCRDLRREEATLTEQCSPQESCEYTEADAVELADEVEALSQDLSGVQRDMLALRLQGIAIPVIAESVDRSERTVRRCLVQIRRLLEGRLAALQENGSGSGSHSSET